MCSIWQPTKNSAVATVHKGYAVIVFEYDNNETTESDSSDADREPKDRHLGDTDCRAATANSGGYEAHDEGDRGVNGRYDDETDEERHHNEEHRGDNRGHEDETDEERHHNEADHERHRNEADDERYEADDEETPKKKDITIKRTTKDTATETTILGRALRGEIDQPKPDRSRLNQNAWSQTVYDLEFSVTPVTK